MKTIRKVVIEKEDATLGLWIQEQGETIVGGPQRAIQALQKLLEGSGVDIPTGMRGRVRVRVPFVPDVQELERLGWSVREVCRFRRLMS